MNNVMLDLETLGTKPGCVILSVGAVMFDPRGNGWGDSFYANVDKQSCLDAGLKTEQSTIDWWAKQSQEAQDALLVDCQPLEKVANDFGAWFSKNSGKKIWSHGACFDIPLMVSALQAVSKEVPWKYSNVRDTRTLYELAMFDPKSIHPVGVAHNALDDCRFQVTCVQSAIRRIAPRF